MKRYVAIAAFSYMAMSVTGIVLFSVSEICIVTLGLVLVLALCAILLKKRTLCAVVCAFSVLASLVMCIRINSYKLYYGYSQNEAVVKAKVLSVNQDYDEDYLTVEVKPLEVNIGNENITFNGNINILYYGNKKVEIDDIIQAQIKLFDFTGSDKFTYRSLSLSKNIFFYAYAEEFISVEQGKRSVEYYLNNIRQKINENLKRYIPKGHYPIASAILLGDRSEMTSLDVNSFRRSGILHATAVSGLHLSYILGSFMLFLNVIKTKRKLKAAVSVVIIIAVMALTGFSPSVLRAGFMGIIAAIAMLLAKEADSINSLGLSLIVIMIITPTSAFDIRLVLSAVSTLGILVFSSPLINKAKVKYKNIRFNKIITAVSSLFFISFGAWIFTLPVIALYFNEVSMVGILTNIILAYPIMVTLLVSILINVFSFIPFLAKILGYIAGGSVFISQKVSEFLSDFDISTIDFTSWPMLLWIFVSVMILIVFALKRFKKPFEKKNMAVIIFAAFVLCFSLTQIKPQSTAQPSDIMKIKVLDVGQGNSLVAHLNGKYIAIDCGADEADLKIQAYLKENNTNYLDVLCLTHYHADHANDVVKLIKAVDIGMIVMPDTADENYREKIENTATEYGVEIKLVSTDQIVDVGELKINVLAKQIELLSNDENEKSLVYILDYHDFEFITTGDLPTGGEKQLLSYYASTVLDCEVMMAGHHGSKNSNSKDFLQAVSPDTVIISAGKDNSYGHPHEEALARFKIFTDEIYRTDISGSITINSDGTENFTVEKEK